MILVTGATGNVGKELVPHFIKDGVTVRVLVRDERKIIEWKNKVEIAIGDLDKLDTLTAAMQGIDQLFFVTPVTAQVENLLRAAKQAGVRHMVKQSTIEADRWLGPGKWHREQEELIKSMGFDWTILRPTMMMVNTIEWWSATIKTQNAVYFPGGKGKVPPVDPRDIAAVAHAVLTHSGHEGMIYELTGPETFTIGEMVQVLAKVLGKPLRYASIPAFLAAIWLRKFGMSRELVNALMETLRALRKNEYAYITDAIERITGSKPRTFEAWCDENAGSFRS